MYGIDSLFEKYPRKISRRFVTFNETTSLLMKEAPNGSGAGGSPLPSARQHMLNGEKTSVVGSESSRESNGGGLSSARSLLQAVRNKTKRMSSKASSMSLDWPAVGRPAKENGCVLSNGHAGCLEAVHDGQACASATVAAGACPSAAAASGSPVSLSRMALRQRDRPHRLHLKSASIAGNPHLHGIRSYALTSATSFTEITSDAQPPRASLFLSSTAATATADQLAAKSEESGGDEHQLIAFHSALLQVGRQSCASAVPTDSPAHSDGGSVGAISLGSSSKTPPQQAIDPCGHGHRHKSNLPGQFMQTLCAAELQAVIPAFDVPPVDDEEQQDLPCSSHSRQTPDAVAHEAQSALRQSGDELLLHRLHNRLCTSFRIQLQSLVRQPVDACLLPNRQIAIADYDNGFLVIDAVGELHAHKNSVEHRNACGVACAPDSKLFVLMFKEGLWSINVYFCIDFELSETIRCPVDAQIESWALRKINAASDRSLHLLASGEAKIAIWDYEFGGGGGWRIVASENSRKGGYNDISVRYDHEARLTYLLLCDWKKCMLETLVVNEKAELVDQRAIRVRRIKGQEWVVQGPSLAMLDEQADIIVYDSSGKLFLFDGDSYKCKKIIADVGRGEVSSLFVRNGWLYVLCRYRLTLEVFLYKEYQETTL